MRRMLFAFLSTIHEGRSLSVLYEISMVQSRTKNVDLSTHYTSCELPADTIEGLLGVGGDLLGGNIDSLQSFILRVDLQD
jgi:hypothetical protein